MSDDPRIDKLAELIWNENPIPAFIDYNWSEIVEKKPRVTESYRGKARGWLAMIDAAASQRTTHLAGCEWFLPSGSCDCGLREVQG